MAVDGRLHSRIEILYTQAGARDAAVGEAPNSVAVEAARVELDGDFGLGRGLEVPTQRIAQPAHVGRRHHAGRTAAPMDVAHAQALWNGARDAFDLAQQELGILRDRRIALGDHSMAAAIPAHGGTERHVQVKRCSGIAWKRPEPSSIGRRIDPGVEMRYRRIARIARQAPLGRRDESSVAIHLPPLGSGRRIAGERERVR